jgi:hypothetical protein
MLPVRGAGKLTVGASSEDRRRHNESSRECDETRVSHG